MIFIVDSSTTDSTPRHCVISADREKIRLNFNRRQTRAELIDFDARKIDMSLQIVSEPSRSGTALIFLQFALASIGELNKSLLLNFQHECMYVNRY